LLCSLVIAITWFVGWLVGYTLITLSLFMSLLSYYPADVFHDDYSFSVLCYALKFS